MNPCIIPPKEKKPRSPRRTSVLFASLEIGARFSFPREWREHTKTSFFKAHTLGTLPKFVNPFRSVMVTPAPKNPRPFPTVEEVIEKYENDGRTHYVGDDCPGGHADVAPTCEHKEWVGCPEVDATCAKCGKDEHEVNEEQERARVPQPNSDNNIIGPIS